MTRHLFTREDFPFELLKVNLTDTTEGQLDQISVEMGLALSIDEMKSIRKHFDKQKRKPTDVELQTLGQTWSEHCYHKTFKGDVLSSNGNTIIKNMFKSCIVKSTNDLNLPWCFSVFEDNAGIVEFDNGYGVAIKVETHNHPSAVEPFGGAATGTGGVIRDVLGVWAEPIACTDVLCFGPLEYPYERLPEGIKHPRYIFRGVVSGIGHYGNNMGIPTVNGAIYFDEGYLGNPLVYCGCIGILPLEKYVKDVKPGDRVVLVGGKTGRDGIHGVTFASLELTEESEEFRPAVQIPNPIEQEKIRRAVIRVRDEGLASSVTDLGGGGLSSAICETTEKHDCGVHVELDKVHLRTSNMKPWEIWISESQERMLLTVRPNNLESVIEVFDDENVEATCIGWFTEDKIVELEYQGIKVAMLDVGFLFKPPTRQLVSEWNGTNYREKKIPLPEDLTIILKRLLSTPNIASKESIIRTYEHEVQGRTVLKPLQGRYSGPNDAAVLKPLSDSWRGIVISCGMNPRYGKIDPYWMAASAIDEAIRNNISVGGRRMALLDNFSWGNPEKPDRLGGLVRAVEACRDFALAYGTPFISGKDSLYNESPLGPVTPSLLVTGIGLVPDVRKVVSMDLKEVGNPVYIVGKTLPELGCSEYYRIMGLLGSSLPRVYPKSSARSMKLITKAIDLGFIRSCHDLSEGGLGVAAAEMSFSGGSGLELHLDMMPQLNVERDDLLLFSESNSRFLLEVSKDKQADFENMMRNCDFGLIGEVRSNSELIIWGLEEDVVVESDIVDLRTSWKNTFGD